MRRRERIKYSKRIPLERLRNNRILVEATNAINSTVTCPLEVLALMDPYGIHLIVFDLT